MRAGRPRSQGCGAAGVVAMTVTPGMPALPGLWMTPRVNRYQRGCKRGLRPS
jgi:hypothetical protein